MANLQWAYDNVYVFHTFLGHRSWCCCSLSMGGNDPAACIRVVSSLEWSDNHQSRNSAGKFGIFPPTPYISYISSCAGKMWWQVNVTIIPCFQTSICFLLWPLLQPSLQVSPNKLKYYACLHHRHRNVVCGNTVTMTVTRISLKVHQKFGKWSFVGNPTYFVHYHGLLLPLCIDSITCHW